MSTNRADGSVTVSGDSMHGKHHAEVLIMNRDADGPGGSGNYHTFDGGRLPTLGRRLSLPEGWTYRARTLEEDLVMAVTFDDDLPNMIGLDELEHNYQLVRTP
jgi:hypothetical protein